LSDHAEITEAMMAAAMEAGKRTGALAADARYADVRRMLAAVLAVISAKDRGPAYPLWVKAAIGTKKARFVAVTERHAYFRLETEDGKELVVHANDILPNRGPH
jgi:hypothetical protein